jgi:hypothetical protein
MNFQINICENKLKMYFSGLILFIFVSIVCLVIIFGLITMNLLDYEVFLKVLFYLFSLFFSISLYLFFRPRHCLDIDDKKVFYYYGKFMKGLIHEFLISDIQSVSTINRYLYEKIKICSSNKCIHIRSVDYKKTDYMTLKRWCQKIQ